MGNLRFFNLTILFLTFLFAMNTFVYSEESQVTVTCHQNRQNGYDFSYEKTVEGSFLVTVRLNNAMNAPGNEFKQVVNAHSGSLFSVNPLNKNSYLRFSTYDTYYYRGVPNPKVDKSFVYALPYKKENTFSVAHVTDSSKDFGNSKGKNFMALEFSSEKCDTARAVRKGVVVSVVDKYEIDTSDKSFTSNANSILIEQPDGTLAHYSGFQRGSIFVTEGQTVLPYTPLGILALNRKLHTLRLMTYYLVDTNSGVPENKTVAPETSKSYNVYLDLLFQTNKGVTKLLDHTSYTSDYNVLLLEREINKKELKAIGKKSRE